MTQHRPALFWRGCRAVVHLCFGYRPPRVLGDMRNGQTIKLAGIVLIRQRPGSAKGVCFITLEDETGVCNLVVWPKIMAAFRKVVMQARVIDVRGSVQRSDDVIHVVVHHLTDRSDVLERLSNDAMQPRLAERNTRPPTQPAHNPEIT